MANRNAKLDKKVSKKIKHAGGRPLVFNTEIELKEKVDDYFRWCDDRTKTIYDNKTGQEIAIVFPAPYTMSGLARYLGIDRRTLLNYSKKDEFFPTIREARNRVEEDVETRLMETKNEKGAMFSLKNNFKWREDPQVLQQFNVGGEMKLEFVTDE